MIFERDLKTTSVSNPFSKRRNFDYRGCCMCGTPPAYKLTAIKDYVHIPPRPKLYLPLLYSKTTFQQENQHEPVK